MYGVINRQQIFDTVDVVCAVLGNGKHNAANKLILGTIAAETSFAEFPDPTPFGAGSGLCQFDLVGFEGVLQRTRQHNIVTLKNEFDIDIQKVTYEMLEYNPLLSVIFCRLFYKLIPEEIPDSLSGMAYYWKKYYNTHLGKGTEQKFIANYNHYIKGAVE
jgi:hypothetical protein